MYNHKILFDSTTNVMLNQAEKLLLNAQQFTQNDYHSVFQKIIQFENACIDSGYRPSEVNDARFFLCAFLDEQCSWNTSLLSTFYETGINEKKDFYDRLEYRQLNAEQHIDLLELAYYCLSLGYRGKFNYNADIIPILDALYSLIRNIKDEAPEQYTSNQSIQVKNKWQFPSIGLTVIITFIILISIFISYNQKLNQQARPILHTLKTFVMHSKQNDMTQPVSS